MHEMGIAMQVIDVATAAIPGHLEGRKVKSINLRIGKLSSVVPDSLRFCFDIVSKDSRVEGAKLFIEEIPVTASCNDCGNKWTIEGPAFSCPVCKGGHTRLISGQELDIESMELEEDQ